MSPVCFVNHVPSTLRLLAPRFSVGLAKPKIHPESRRDGAHACNVFARSMEKHKPGATPVNVKLLLPPWQRRGFSQSNRSIQLCSESPHEAFPASALKLEWL